ncbi:MAG: type I DNA topoisomerase [Patescibacteria group bacterium]
MESPTKARTIKSFLGKDYNVLASMGHVRDLPKAEFGVDIERDFEPKYVIPTKARKTISLLKQESSKADNVILATDKDREGESISWHLQEALKLKNPKRIVFHEITKEAIREALENPRKIDMNLVDAQQARRILDRIVGYKLSPFLWKKVSRGLSAGRVQSVAVRLVVEREEEIKKFIPVEYWSIEAVLKKNSRQFSAFLAKKDGKTTEKLEIKNKEEASRVLKDLNGAEYKVKKVHRKETKRNPFPPFTTSTLQQTAANKFGYSAKYTMSLAQGLYEEGRITYHRSDSLNLSQMSLVTAEKFIISSFGKKYSQIKRYKAGKGAQEAHEAIRPTYANKTPDLLRGKLETPKLKLYTLIWQRFIASQMTSAIFDTTSIEIQANQYTFITNGQILKFEGFLKVYPIKFSENELPNLKEKEILELIRLNPEQHFTEPPARYNEASLIKALEKYGIGRPSTYAPTLAIIQERNYIKKNEQKRLFPTEMGIIVNNVLVKNFPEIVDIDFTAKMEKELDEIAEGKDTWQKTCRDFYGPFAKNLEKKYKEVKKESTDIKTDKICPKCGKFMVEKLGRFGRFYACTGFPECKHTESLESEVLEINCPKCSIRTAQPSLNSSGYSNASTQIGNIVVKKTKRGKIFYGCNNYPKCDFASWDKPINEFCPKCKSILVETKTKKIYPVKSAEGGVSQDAKQFNRVKCLNKDCDYRKNAESNSKTD